jgi:hypothetical protein
MRTAHRFGFLLASAVCLIVTGANAAAADWPQLQNGPQRLGYSPEPVDTPLQNA